MALKLEGYVKSPDGFGVGSYEVLHPKGVSLELIRSLFGGDVLKITSFRNTPDPALEKARGIRLYDSSIKLFDGYLRAPDYLRGSNKYRTLTTSVYDWRKELEAISTRDEASYADKTLSFIIQDLCRIANSSGVTKMQSYKFDLSKLPYQSDIFESDLISPTFTGTVWNALMDLTKYMDVLELLREGQWTIKTDSLQSDYYIYIIPQMATIDEIVFGTYEVGSGYSDLYTHPYGLKLWVTTETEITVSNLNLTITYTDQDGNSSNTATLTIPKGTFKGVSFPVKLEQGDILVKDVSSVISSGGGSGNVVMIKGRVTRTLPDFKLQPPKEIWKDYKRLLNYADVIGPDGLESQVHGDMPLLGTTDITSNDFYVNPTLQPAAVNYLKVTITNPTATDSTGSVKLRGFSGPPEGPDELLEERFFLNVPAGEAIYHATDNRYYSLSMNVEPNTGLHITGFWGCTVELEEFMYGVAGRSINLFGLRAGRFMSKDFDTQTKCDNYARELVSLFHAPTVHIAADLKPGYIDASDLAGKTVRMEDELTGTEMDFLCTKQTLKFSMKRRYEQIEAMRYNMDWEYTE